MILAFVLSWACTSSSEPEPSDLRTPACARLSACFEFDGLRGGFDNCTSALPPVPFSSAGLGGLAGLAGGGDDPVFECVLNAPDCDAAGRCINAGMPSGPCEDRGCEGDILRSCAGEVAVAYDCSEIGETCIESEPGSAQCGRPASCPERISMCRDGRPVYCSDDIEWEAPCDLDCVVDRDQALCIDTTGSACDRGTPSARCDGNEAINCPFGFETRTSCPSGTCQVTSDGALCVVPRACSMSTCEGDTLVACVRGRLVPVDCAEVGARTCVSEDRGPRCLL